MAAQKISDHAGRDGAERTASGPKRLRILLALSAAAAAAVALAACSSSGAPSAGGSRSPAAATAVSVKTAKIGSEMVLINANGFTLYAFSPDTHTTSKCNGKCATVWPPVKGPVTADGIKGTFGTITRSDGSVQATFDGHPLYAYVGDKAPGQANGNGLNAAGGLWTEITASVSTATADGSPAGPGSGSGY